MSGWVGDWWGSKSCRAKGSRHERPQAHWVFTQQFPIEDRAAQYNTGQPRSSRMFRDIPEQTRTTQNYPEGPWTTLNNLKGQRIAGLDDWMIGWGSNKTAIHNHRGSGGLVQYRTTQEFLDVQGHPRTNQNHSELPRRTLNDPKQLKGAKDCRTGWLDDWMRLK